MATPGGFETASIRQVVLDAWCASPERLREDANLEEDFAAGHYRDRAVIELLQNAADAAGRDGRAVARLSDGADPTLIVGNTGEPLSAAGVRSLAGLRSSTKSAAGVGTFGVGFAAVRAVSDDVTVLSRTGAIRFRLDEALAETTRLVERNPAIGPLLAERGASIAMLRLPFDAADATRRLGEDDLVTEVQLRLHPDAAESVRKQLSELSELTLLALPGLNAIDIEIDGQRRELRDPSRHWLLATAHGGLPAAAVAALPLEQRTRTAWRVTWALPRTPGQAGKAAPILAPTPVDDLSTLPARLVAALPLDATRRRIPRTEATDHVLRAAAASYADLATQLAADGDPRAFELIPAGLPAGEIDAELHQAITEALRDAPILPGPPGGRRLAPREAVQLPPHLWRQLTDRQAAEAWQALAELEPRLTMLPPAATSAAARLGIEQADLADLIDRVPVTWPLESYERLYRALRPLASGERIEEVATLPVPLADGSRRRGARGILLVAVSDDASAAALARLTQAGLRIADPALAHGEAAELLAALGAARTEVRQLLALPDIAQLADDVADQEAGALAEAVLRLVAELPGDDEGWAFPGLGRLLLPAADGTLAPAEDLVLPGSAADRIFGGALAPVAPDTVTRWGLAPLAAIGVHSSLTLLRGADRPLADGWDEFDDDERPGDDAAALADLDLIEPSAWPLALREIATRPELRAAVLVPGSYLSWWLSHRAEPPVAVPFGLTTDVPGLPGPPGMVEDLLGDSELMRALGGVASLPDLSPVQWRDLLTAGPAGVSPNEAVPSGAALAWWRGLAAVASLDTWPAAPPRLVPAIRGERLEWCEAGRVVVADGGQWLQLPELGPFVPQPSSLAAEVADLLDAPLASEVAPGHVRVESPQSRVIGPASHLYAPAAPDQWWECDGLTVDGVAVEWWLSDDGEIYACTLEGLAAAIAETAGIPASAPAIAELLADGEDGPAARGAAAALARET